MEVRELVVKVREIIGYPCEIRFREYSCGVSDGFTEASSCWLVTVRVLRGINIYKQDLAKCYSDIDCCRVDLLAADAILCAQEIRRRLDADESTYQKTMTQDAINKGLML